MAIMNPSCPSVNAPTPHTGASLPRTEPTAAIVQDYIQHVRQRACEHLAFYAEQPSLDHALEVVATWRNPEGKVERHQRRLRRDVKRVAGELIRRLELRAATSFEVVFERVQEALGGVHGAGDLVVYDVALRLAAVLGLPPQRVYLHRGSRSGARALGIRTNERSLPLDAFPREFRRLHAWEIENLLCVYKHRLSTPRNLAS